MLCTTMRIPVVLMRVALTFVLVFSPPSVDAWAAFGHMVVAEIARRNLDAEVLEVVNELTKHLTESGPFPTIPDFVQSACWPDDLKGFDLKVMNGWHYTANVYYRDGTVPKVPLEQETNIVTVIGSMTRALKREGNPLYVRSFALAHLVHHYGDIHQPLHTTSQVSAQFADGDLGGNKVEVKVRNTTTKLHSFWDAICRAPISMKRPLSEKDYDKVRNFAENLTRTYLVSKVDQEETNETTISLEGFELAKEVAYAGVVDGGRLSDEYVMNCLKTAEQRMTVAGYRLATHLNKILKKDAGFPVEPPPEASPTPEPGSGSQSVAVRGRTAFAVIVVLATLLCCV